MREMLWMANAIRDLADFAERNELPLLAGQLSECIYVAQLELLAGEGADATSSDKNVSDQRPSFRH